MYFILFLKMVHLVWYYVHTEQFLTVLVNDYHTNIIKMTKKSDIQILTFIVELKRWCLSKNKNMNYITLNEKIYIALYLRYVLNTK